VEIDCRDGGTDWARVPLDSEERRPDRMFTTRGTTRMSIGRRRHNTISTSWEWKSRRGQDGPVTTENGKRVVENLRSDWAGLRLDTVGTVNENGARWAASTTGSEVTGRTRANSEEREEASIGVGGDSGAESPGNG